MIRRPTNTPRTTSCLRPRHPAGNSMPGRHKKERSFARSEFFSKGQACLRGSGLGKRVIDEPRLSMGAERSLYECDGQPCYWICFHTEGRMPREPAVYDARPSRRLFVTANGYMTPRRCRSAPKWGHLWASRLSRDHGGRFGPRGYPQVSRMKLRAASGKRRRSDGRPLDAYGALAYMRTRSDVRGSHRAAGLVERRKRTLEIKLWLGHSRRRGRRHRALRRRQRALSGACARSEAFPDPRDANQARLELRRPHSTLHGVVFVFLTVIMPGRVPGIHVLGPASKSWMAGSSPAMTTEEVDFAWGCFRSFVLGRVKSPKTSAAASRPSP